jgi:hypothetical protein
MPYLLLIERKKKKGETDWSFFPLGKTCSVRCTALGFSQLLGSIKG